MSTLTSSSNPTKRRRRKMTFKSIRSQGIHYLRIGMAGLAMVPLTIGAPFANAAPKPQKARDYGTVSPIKHVIVIIGENRSFDHVFATFVPKNGESVNNLLSEGIIKLDANKNAVPGPNFAKAQQLFAEDYGTFLLDPPSEPFSSPAGVAGPQQKYGVM